MGAVKSKTRFEIVRPYPKYAVAVKLSIPCVRYSLKKIGKKAARTVVANAEFPASYTIHDFAGIESLDSFIKRNPFTDIP